MALVVKPSQCSLGRQSHAPWSSAGPQARCCCCFVPNVGVRGFEIDIHADPEGGRYAQVAGLRLAGLNGTLPYRDLYEPGFKASGVGGLLCGHCGLACWLSWASGQERRHSGLGRHIQHA